MKKEIGSYIFKIALISVFVILASFIAFKEIMVIGGDAASLDLLRGQFMIADIMTIAISSAIIIK